jgi:hypothetical protein
MQQKITITYNSGEEASYIAQPPEFAKWEKTTGKPISEIGGIWDILFLAYNAMKRSNGGKPVKPFEVWMDSVVDVGAENEDPKVTQSEASIDS